MFDKSEAAEAVRGQTVLLLLFVILHRSYFLYKQHDILSLLYMNVSICCFVFQLLFFKNAAACKYM